MSENFGSRQTWLPGQIQEIQGPMSYDVVLNDGCSFKRHVDHYYTKEQLLM